MEKIVVNDTNIFIDLFNVDLLDEFFSIPWEVHTTRFVMLELLREEQQAKVTPYLELGKLQIPNLESKEIAEIGRLFQQYENQTNLSFTDCSVWYYAKVNNYVLLTGDRKLRTVAAFDGIEVHGILHVFDRLVDNGIISYQVAIERIELLYQTNPRLPKDEKDKRLQAWKTEIEKKGGSL